MPRIPTYPAGGTVDLAPLPGVKQQSIASPEIMFNDGGAGEFSKAMKPVVVALEMEAERVNEARVQEKYAQLAKAANQSIYGDGGVVSQLGASAVGAADRWGGDYDKVAQELAADLTPRQQAMFGKYAMQLKMRNHDVVLRHESAQVKAHRDDAFKQFIEAGMETAALNYTDGIMVGTQIMRAEKALGERPEYLGASADVRAGMMRDLRGGFHSAAIMRALESGDTAGANGYFEGVKGELPLKLRSQLESKLKPATDFGNGKVIFQDASAKIERGEMTIVEAERYILEKARNKEELQVAQSFMREMQDAQRRQSNEARGGVLEQFLGAPTTATLNKIRGSREFQNMDSADRAYVLDYMQSKVKSNADQAQSRRERSLESYVEFDRVASSPEFPTMTVKEIYALAPKIGEEKAHRLVEMQRSQRNQASKFQIDKDLLNEAMPKELVDAKGESEKLKANAFRGIVESELQDWKMRNPGKVPTLEEQKQIARSANTEYREVNKYWFDDVTKAYELKPMPSDFRQQASEALRLRNKPVTESALRELWAKQKESH